MPMPMVSVHMGASAVMMVVTAMHSALAGLDDHALCAGHRRDRNCKRCGGRKNKTKLSHLSLL
jgi:hypothetical protein